MEGLPLISVMTAVNFPRGSRNRSVGNPTYWGIIHYVVTSSRDTNGLVVVAAMRCDQHSGEKYIWPSFTTSLVNALTL